MEGPAGGKAETAPGSPAEEAGQVPRAPGLIGRCGSGWGRRGQGLALQEAAAPPPRPRRGTIWSRQQRCPPAGMSLLR